MQQEENTVPFAEMARMSRRTSLYALAAMSLGGLGVPAGRAIATTVPEFVHPGQLHTRADLQRMQDFLHQEPWASTWARLTSSPFASLTRNSGPALPVVYRGFNGVNPQNYGILYRDVAAAYALALRWRLSGDERYAAKAVGICDSWSATLTAISGNADRFLAAGIYGHQFANAGELLRDYPGWSAEGQARFKHMMRNVFYPLCHDFLVNHNGQGGVKSLHYYANWDLCNMAAVMAIGILCDDRALFDEAVDYFKNGQGSGAIAHAVYYVHPGHLGQWQESGRDQGHTVLGAALVGAICEMAWNQGVDLYGWDNNRVLMGMEYVAKSNLRGADGAFNQVPFVTFWNALVKGANAQRVFSTWGIGTLRPCWALLYNHYVRRKGLAAPYTEQMARLVAPEGGGGHYGPNSGGFDQLGYGTLTHTQAQAAAGTGPSGLTWHVDGGRVVLSWWGCAGATSYSVLRAPTPRGPYTTLADNVADPLTWADTPPADGTWHYRVHAVMADGRLLPSAAVAARCGTHVLAHLPLQQAVGNVVADVSGQGVDGRLEDGAIIAAGRNAERSALVLNGGRACLSLPAGVFDDVGDFSIALWVNSNANRRDAKAFDFGLGINRYLQFTPFNRWGRAHFALSVTSVDGELTLEPAQGFPLRQWVHVAVTVSGRTATMYWNGQVVATNNDFFQAPFRLGRTTQNTLGRSQISSQPHFAGRLDDLRIYRGALTPGQVQAAMQNQPVLVDASAGLSLSVRRPTQTRGSPFFLSEIDVFNQAGPVVEGRFLLVLRNLPAGITVLEGAGLIDGAPSVATSLRIAPGGRGKVQVRLVSSERAAIQYQPQLLRDVGGV